MILDEIVKQRRIQLEKETARCTLGDMKKRAEEQLARRTPLSLAKALRQDTLSCICEVKKASPSKGLIRPDFRPVQFAKEYEAAGADAISCLTEEHYFQGSSEYLAAIRKEVGIPILRKDFIFDEYQIFEAAALGADAVLICRPIAVSWFGAGAEGVKVYVEKLKGELKEAMYMCGARSLADIGPEMVR